MSTLPPRQTILLVEDQTDLRENLARFLEFQGYGVLQAADGEAAYQLAAEQEFSLVITDLSMPGWDGSRLCRELAATPATARLPVVVLTAWTIEPGQLECENCNIVGTISKPFRLEEITRTLTSLLGKRPLPSASG